MNPLCNWLAILQIVATPLAILGLGFWVNTTIRRKSQKNSIIVSYLQGLQSKIHNLIDESISTDNSHKCTKVLRSLSNEIEHLIDLYEHFNKSSEGVQPIHRLKEKLFGMKNHLTGSGDNAIEEDIERARQSSNELKQEVLDLMLRMCELQK